VVAVVSAVKFALAYARLGWRVGQVEPGGKVPLTTACPRGVHSFTTDPDLIRSWWERRPDANVAIACGAPGPDVVDIDVPRRARELLARLGGLGAPEVATARGRHFYFAGTTRSTVGLPYGELRACGGFVVAPPSVHSTGKLYTWLAPPRGPLPPLPPGLTRGVTSVGAGVMPDLEQVPPGQMYGHLLDLAMRYAQVGRILNANVVERILLVQFEAVRVPGASYGDPREGRRDTRRIAEFAVRSEIAERERGRAEFAARWRTRPPGAGA
jgi:hypothetical protein